MTDKHAMKNNSGKKSDNYSSTGEIMRNQKPRQPREAKKPKQRREQIIPEDRKKPEIKLKTESGLLESQQLKKSEEKLVNEFEEKSDNSSLKAGNILEKLQAKFRSFENIWPLSAIACTVLLTVATALFLGFGLKTCNKGRL